MNRGVTSTFLDKRPEGMELKEAPRRSRSRIDPTKDSRPGTSNSAKKRRDPREAVSQNNLELQGKLVELQDQLEKERERVKQMELEMESRQERYIRREKEYRKSLSEYEAEVRSRKNYTAVPVGEQSHRNMEKVKKLHGVIEQNIASIQKKTSMILDEHKIDVSRQFQTKLNEILKNLEDEKKKKLDGVGNFAEKELKLVRELELMKASADLIESKNQSLAEENKAISREFQEQESDREQLSRHVVDLKRESAHLKEELAKYRELSMSISGQSSRAEFVPKGAKTTGSRFRSVNSSVQDDITVKYESVVTKLKRMLEIEKKNLMEARTTYSKELESKTELENLLRQCVEDVKSEITRRRVEQKSSIREPEISQQDREKIIEVLLSQERVLTLLYDKTFPPRSVVKESHQKGESNFMENLRNIDKNINSIQEVYDRKKEDFLQDSDEEA